MQLDADCSPASLAAQVFYKVCYEEHKPPMPEHMPGAYADLMVRCWDTDSTKRPTFTYAPPPRRLHTAPPQSALQALKVGTH